MKQRPHKSDSQLPSNVAIKNFILSRQKSWLSLADSEEKWR
jgi:hypothetical protein